MASRNELENLRLSELRLFVQVAEVGTLREVARNNRIEPAQLSKCIKKIESMSGSKLFLRSTQGVSLTLAGQRFRDHANAVLRASESLTPERPRETRETQAHYTIAAPSFIHGPLARYVIPKLSARQGAPMFRLLSMGQDQMVRAGINGLFQIAVHVKELDWPRSWTTLRAGKFSSSLFQRTPNKVTNSAPMTIDVKQAKRLHYVVPVYWSKNRIYQGNDNCPLPQEERKIALEVSTADIALEIISRTSFVGYMPDLVAKEALDAKRVQRIEVEGWENRPALVYLTIRPDKVLQSFYRQFLSELEAVTQ